ncbi:hypothetical protein CK203_106437 [Vitis vinifera]|uniref:Uncharacterized protein n=1 Tax=Vitis vinifera TaxID=29760 RepID=A0A438DGQ1_VITVI|nr:hypothetical protein CK203_106437 [Vitis vinifera]
MRPTSGSRRTDESSGEALSDKGNSHPPKKKAKVFEPELIDLSEPVSEPSIEPQPSQPPPSDSQTPSGMTPEVLIRASHAHSAAH